MTNRQPIDEISLRACAAPGLISYRYKTPYGYCMIGAKDHADALNEARRSIDGEPDPAKLVVWNVDHYERAFPVAS